MGLMWVSLFMSIFLFLPQMATDAAAAGGGDDPVIFEPVTGTPEYESTFEEESAAAGDVFGSRWGYIHPFLSVGGYYTSNLFNSDTDEKSDEVMVISPGIWLALPASRQELVEVETLNTAPGGLAVSRFETETERRFQAYALYRGAFQENRHYQEAETEDHRAEGLLRYRMRGGLSFEVLDIFENDHDPFSTGDAAARELDTFKSNLINPVVRYEVSPKTRLQVGYSRYDLNYDSARRSFRDREDNTASAGIFYRFAPKTSLSLDYEYIAVDYDSNDARDNHENLVFGGLEWRATEKSLGRIRVGYGKKKYEGPGGDDRNFLAIETQVNHRFTRKTSVSLRLVRTADEADVQGVRDVLTHRVKLGYTQLLTAKITGKLVASYIRNDYSGDITEGGKTDQRLDNQYQAEASLGFSPTRWLNFSTGYIYAQRDSNFETRDYNDHTIYFHVTAAM